MTKVYGPSKSHGSAKNGPKWPTSGSPGVEPLVEKKFEARFEVLVRKTPSMPILNKIEGGRCHRWARLAWIASILERPPFSNNLTSRPFTDPKMIFSQKLVQ